MKILTTLKLLAAVTLASFFLVSGVHAKPFELVYTGNLNGELEPCGCTAMSDFGGLKRRATALADIRKTLTEQQRSLFVISNGGLITEHDASDLIRSQYIFSGMAMLAFDAIAVQPQDLSFGLDLMLPEQLRWVSLHPAFPDRRLLNTGGVKLAVFSWPELQWVDNSRVQARNEDIFTALVAAKKSGYITLLLSPHQRDAALAKLPKGPIDLLVVRARDEKIQPPEQSGDMLILSPGTRGMLMGQVSLDIDDSGKLSMLEHRIVELSDQVADAESMADWYQQYNDAISQHYKAQVAQRKAQEQGSSPFAGEETCATCHPQQHAVWKNSRHAGALETLVKVNKDFDPHCLECHTVGFNQDGGYLDQYITAGLANVQCENCHGAAREHSRNPALKPPNKNLLEQPVCNNCHNHDHSPIFDLKKYWPKIQH